MLFDSLEKQMKNTPLKGELSELLEGEIESVV